jgi:hypothetical protein
VVADRHAALRRPLPRGDDRVGLAQEREQVADDVLRALRVVVDAHRGLVREVDADDGEDLAAAVVGERDAADQRRGDPHAGPPGHRPEHRLGEREPLRRRHGRAAAAAEAVNRVGGTSARTAEFMIDRDDGVYARGDGRGSSP